MSLTQTIPKCAVIAILALVSVPAPAHSSQSALPENTPASKSSDLPEIGHVQTSALCEALKSRIAPTLLGVMRNDEALMAARRALSKMSDDAGNSGLGNMSNALQMERAYLHRVVAVLDHNVQLAKRLARPTPTASSVDAKQDQAEATQRALDKVIDQQAEAANLVAGVLETDEMGQMQSSFPSNAAAAPINPRGKSGSSGANSRNTFLSVAGLPDGPSEVGLSAAQTPAQLGASSRSLSDGGVRGHTVYDKVLALLGTMQLQLTDSEKVAGDDIVEAVNSCVPHPTAKPSSPNSQR